MLHAVSIPVLNDATIIDPSGEKEASSLRLEQQQLYGLWVDNRYEVWRDGVYRRKSFTPHPEVGPVTPSILQDVPQAHRNACLERISGRPAYISAIGHRVDDDRELIGLTYLASSSPEEGEIEAGEETEEGARPVGPSFDVWKTIWVKHSQIADARKILELSDEVFPVRTSSAKSMSDFLTDCYDANVGLAPKKTIVKRAGYHQVDGKHGWLVGSEWIGPGTVMGDPNKDRLAMALHKRGDLQSWIDFTKGEWEKDQRGGTIIRFMIGASFAAPLLRFVDLRTFFLHHYTQSGGAKSTLAFLGQSIWGHPKEFSMMLNHATQNSVTEVFKYLSDLPLLLDELQGKTLNVSDFVMQACGEQHKTRAGQEGGLLADGAKRWRTLIRTTGEQTLAGADTSDPGGQANRVLEVRHPGLGVEQGTRIHIWCERAQHYGHAGPIFLSKLAQLVSDPERLEGLRQRYDLFTAEIHKILHEDKKQSATDKQLAVVALGEFLMLRWIYACDAKTAAQTALDDAIEIGANWLRVRDSNLTLASRGLEALAQHRHQLPQLYANVQTEEGRNKLINLGSKTSLPLVAATNAGQRGDEIWYLPDAINKYLREKFSAPPDRFWEELAADGILDRNRDRLTRHRQIKGVVSGHVYVVKMERVFTPQETEEVESDISEMINALDDGWVEWYGEG